MKCGCADIDMRPVFGYCARCGGTTSHRVEVVAVIPPGETCETFDPELLARDHATEVLTSIGIERGSKATNEVFAIVERAWFDGYRTGLARR
jgi:hypothetical protein